MTNTMLMTTPATGLSGHVASTHSAHTAPNAGVQGTGLPFAGSTAALADAIVIATAAQVAVDGARVLALPGPPPRGAPV